MSGIGAWTYTHQLSFWRPSFDLYGQPSYTKVYELAGAYQRQGALRPDGGVQTAEAAAGVDTYYFEYSGEEPPTVGWLVALGSFEGAPPASAKKITTCTEYDVAMFGEDVPDYQVQAQ